MNLVSVEVAYQVQYELIRGYIIRFSLYEFRHWKEIR